MQTVSGYNIEFLHRPYQYNIPSEIKFDSVQSDLINNEVNELVSKGAIVPCEWESEQFVSNIFIVPKPNGKVRPVINLRHLNKFVVYEHFKQEHLKITLDLIQENDYFIKIDLTEAYFSVPIDEEYTKFLKFLHKGKLYKFVVLPFGLASAPRVFTRILKPIYAWFRHQGFRCSYFLDDSLGMNQDVGVCRQHGLTMCEVLDSLGFTVNDKKSSLVPKQRLVFFGFILDSVAFMIYLTQEKVDKIILSATVLISKKTVTVRKLASFIGLIINAFYAVLEAPLHYRSLERNKIAGLGKNNNYDNMTELTGKSLEELHWWIDNIKQKNGKRIRPKSVDFHCRTDASLLGWGCFECNSGKHANGRWNMFEKSNAINYLELLAIFYALQSLYGEHQNEHIHIQSDSVVAVAYINDMGGMASSKMDSLAKQIWQFCIDRNIFVSATHISGLENREADFFSRNFSDSTEWMLKEQIFERICEHFFFPDIDLFASRLNTKLENFVSWFPEPGCIANDAFSISWKDYLPYLFPPFNLVGKVINKLKEDKVRKAILIFPYWKSQSWFPLILTCIVSYPVRLPRHRDLLTMPHSGKVHPMGPRLNLVAAVVSGNVCLNREFVRKLSKPYKRPGGKERKNNTVWPGTSGMFGVCQEKEIPFGRLKLKF